MHKTKGFSLIELLIVVAIMLVIAAIAIPSLMRSRMAANEASCAASLRILASAEITYSTIYNSGFTDDLSKLGPPALGSVPTFENSGLVDLVLAGATPGAPPPVAAGLLSFTKSGYVFTYTPGGTWPEISSFSITADPQAKNSTGIRYFFVNESAVVRANSLTTATLSDSPM